MVRKARLSAQSHTGSLGARDDPSSFSGVFPRAFRGALCCALLVIATCISTPAQAARVLMPISLTSESGFFLTVENDGVAPATFRVESGGGPVIANWTEADGDFVSVPVEIHIAGTLGQNAIDFGDAMLESIAPDEIDVVVSTLDGKIVFSRTDVGPWRTQIYRYSHNPIATGVSFLAWNTHRYYYTDFEELDVFTYHPKVGGFWRGTFPMDVGTVLGNGSMSGFRAPLSSLGITVGVPEPSTWMLLIGGFGLAGAVLRRRRLEVQPASGFGRDRRQR